VFSGSVTSSKKRKPKAHERGLAIEQRKIELYEKREAHKESLRVQEDNADLQFFKSILPEVAKVKDKLRFRGQVINLLSEFLQGEELDCLHEIH
jgi:hypothetical protein